MGLSAWPFTVLPASLRASARRPVTVVQAEPLRGGKSKLPPPGSKTGFNFKKELDMLEEMDANAGEMITLKKKMMPDGTDMRPDALEPTSEARLDSAQWIVLPKLEGELLFTVISFSTLSLLLFGAVQFVVNAGAVRFNG